MKKTPNKYKEIMKFEESMLIEYIQCIKKYESQFRIYGVDVNVGLFRYNVNKNERILEMNPFVIRNGYTCLVYCDICKEGKVIQVVGDDESEYYDVATTWTITTVRGISKYVHMNEDITDIDEEIIYLISLLEKDRIIEP